jgi:multiple sugar transport system substrate-binding protein
VKKIGTFLLLAVILTLAIAPIRAQDKPFAGKKIVIVTQQGSAIGGPAEDYGKQWAEQSGATVEVQRFAFSDLFPKIITALQTKSGEFDVLLFAADWMGDIAGGGYVLPVPDDVKKAVDWEDILPLYRERIADWGGTTYAIPFDGDSHMMYYRKDLVNPNSQYNADFKAANGFDLNEPQTWNQYKAIAQFFQGKEVDTAGVTAPIYGVAEALKKKAQSYWFLMDRAAGYAKVPGDPYFFFDENMKALVNTPGWVQGLQDWVDIYKCCAAPDMINFDVVNVRAVFPAGQTVFGLDWGDVGPISVDPKASVIKGLTGFGVTPGAEKYWDRKTGAWVNAEKGVNKAPFIAYGGWVASVTKDSKNADAAWDFLKFFGNKENTGKMAVTGGTGVNPLRQSQFDNLAAWTAAGFDEESAKDYLQAIQDTINDPNAILDIRIPGSNEYFNALDDGIAKAMAGEATPQAALDEVDKNWDAITERLGKDAQLAAYKAALGVK